MKLLNLDFFKDIKVEEDSLGRGRENVARGRGDK